MSCDANIRILFYKDVTSALLFQGRPHGVPGQAATLVRAEGMGGCYSVRKYALWLIK